MTLLDSRTALAVAALLFTVLPLLVWWATAGHRRDAIGWWCAGSILASLGILLVIARPWLPTIVTYHGANTCLYASLLLWSQALRAILRQPWSALFVGFAISVAAACYSMVYEAATPEFRAIYSRIVLSAFAFYTAAAAFRVTRQLRSHNPTAIGISYAAFGMTLLGQTALMLASGTASSVFSGAWDAAILALVVLITVLIGHFAVTGLVLELSVQEQMQVTVARADARKTAEIDSQLRRLDHGDRINFVSQSLAHELNQPLTVALTQAHITQRRLMLGRADTDMLAGLLHKIGAALQRATALLTRIRTEAPLGIAEPAIFDLRKTAEAALDLSRIEASYRDATIQLATGDRPLLIRGDEIAVSQVLGNLLRNAIEALDGGRANRIDIRCEAVGQEAIVTIRDYGTGVDSAVLNRWGEPFLSNRRHGMGLGLAICKAIVEQHQGALALTNHAEGGAVATFRLPLHSGGLDARLG